MAKRYWLCRRCGSRWPRSRRNCNSTGCEGRRPPARVPKHAKTHNATSYERYHELNGLIHGVTDESCGVCGKPRSQERRHDRDHDHTTGNPRGLACHRCNRVMVRELNLTRARAIVAYLERVDDYYRKAA